MKLRSHYFVVVVISAFFAFLYMRQLSIPEPLNVRIAPVAADPTEEFSGGATTVRDTSVNAFGFSPMNLTGERWPPFLEGKRFLDRDWSRPRRHGEISPVGPRFSATSCISCHHKDGRGRPPLEAGETPVSIVVQLSHVGDDGAVSPDPRYGEQLDYHGVAGSPAEGDLTITCGEVRGRFATGERYTLGKPSYTLGMLAYGPLPDDTKFSIRTAPAIFGLGLLEAVPDRTILAMADPDDRDRDGISGRPNYVRDMKSGTMRLGRFGWKANQPSLEQQIAKALASDMGITSSLFPREIRGDHGASSPPEITDSTLHSLLYYMSLVAPPARRRWNDAAVLRGKALFTMLQCARCHAPTMTTGPAPGFPELARQVIHPYTDLLLHDMGEGLADDRPDSRADGREWRTPPLWGIGLVKTVNGHTRFLHDGRARSMEEAILWHGGEAAGAEGMYVRLRRDDREALLAFLGSL